jgi:signal transduction histidine kinase
MRSAPASPAMVPSLLHALRVHAERPIAVARVALAAASLLAVWLDPAEPQRYVAATYSVLIVYVLYSLAVLPFAWRRDTTRHFGLVTHLADVAVFSLLQVVTLGPSSPFFVYFVFSVCCGALRWDWRGTLATAALVFVSYLVMGAWMAGTLPPAAFELNRFIIRAVYLAVISSLLLVLGHHEIRLRSLAAREERIRLARDLHDGVLQSLTGIRLELQALAGAAFDAAEPARDRLLALERALALEQRELRFFIEGLRPGGIAAAARSLDEALTRVRERIAMEWKVPVEIRVAPQTSVTYDHEVAIAAMVHEAVVNALKHGEPSRVAVNVRTGGDAIHIVVADDGRGFGFEGRHDRGTLVQMNACPASLRDRLESLGGNLTVESSRAGTRVEISLPLVTAGT